jgi:LAO/AO transport system kinase
VVLAPGLGDTIQSMKAGVMEIADLYVVNKADRSGADELVSEVTVRVEQDSQIKKAVWKPPIVKTIAVENQGTDTLVEAVEKHRSFLQESGKLTKNRREKTRQETLALLRDEISRNVLEKVLGNGRFDALIDDIVAHKKDPYTSVQQIIRTIFPEE